MIEIKDITLINSAHPSRLNRIKQMFNYFKDISCCKIHVTRDKNLIKFPTSGFNIIENSGNWIHRQNTALQMVKTPYIMFIMEDDIYNIDYIIKSIEFLRKNKDYIATWGMVYSHKNKSIYIEKGDAMQFSYMLKKNYPPSNILETIVYYLTNMNSYTLNHSIIISDVFKKLYSFLVNHEEYHTLGYSDRLGLLMASTFGNIKMLKCIHMLKDRNGKIRNCPTEKHLEVKPWTHFYKENLEFCKFLAHETKLDINKLKTAVDKTQNLWHKKEYINYDLKEFIKKNQSLANSMLNRYYA